jgi:hypothetical protein
MNKIPAGFALLRVTALPMAGFDGKSPSLWNGSRWESGARTAARPHTGQALRLH